MARSSQHVLNSETGEWDLVNSNNQTSSSGGDNLTSSNSNKNSGTGSVEKKNNNIQINTLSGELSYIVTEETIKLKAGDTVELQGLGKSLSGNYYVKEISRQISSNGYSHNATLIKTDFGESLKLYSTSTKDTKEETSQSSPKSDSSNRTYTVKKGDTLWKIAKMFYGNGSLYQKIYDANTKKVANPNLIYIGQVFVIP